MDPPSPLLSSQYGVVKVAALYGPFKWTVMSLAVIPPLMQRPPAITFRWWVQLFGHLPFVGIPIVASIGRGAPDPEGYVHVGTRCVPRLASR